MKQYDIQAIDAVVNLWTPEMLAIRPNRDAFYGGKMKVTQQDLQGVSHEEMLRRMDAAGIEKSFLIAAKVGPIMHKASYHTPYEMVAEAIHRYPDRFHGLAGLDATQGMDGVRELGKSIETIGDVRGSGLFIGVEFVTDRETQNPGTQITKDLIEFARENGVFLSSDGPAENVLKIKPPMIIGTKEVDIFLDVLERGLKSI